MSHMKNEQGRIAIRRCALVRGPDGWGVAGDTRFAEPAAQSLHPRELPGVPIRRATSQLGLVWPPEGAAFFCVRAGGACAGGTRCLDNGRAVQELLYEAAPRYIKALKRERAKAAARQGG